MIHPWGEMCWPLPCSQGDHERCFEPPPSSGLTLSAAVIATRWTGQTMARLNDSRCLCCSPSGSMQRMQLELPLSQSKCSDCLSTAFLLLCTSKDMQKNPSQTFREWICFGPEANISWPQMMRKGLSPKTTKFKASGGVKRCSRWSNLNGISNGFIKLKFFVALLLPLTSSDHTGWNLWSVI